jgi:hypothetical protein
MDALLPNPLQNVSQPCYAFCQCLLSFYQICSRSSPIVTSCSRRLVSATCSFQKFLSGAVASDKQNLTCVRLTHHDDWRGEGGAKSTFRHSNVVKACKYVSGRMGLWSEPQRHLQLYSSPAHKAYF